MRWKSDNYKGSSRESQINNMIEPLKLFNILGAPISFSLTVHDWKNYDALKISRIPRNRIDPLLLENVGFLFISLSLIILIIITFF